jgi:hypothetical protein
VFKKIIIFKFENFKLQLWPRWIIVSWTSCFQLYFLSNTIILIFFSEKQANLSLKLLLLSTHSISSFGHTSSLTSSIHRNNENVKKELYMLPDANEFHTRGLSENNTTIMLLIPSTSCVLLFFLKWRKTNIGRFLHLT